ncbi:hypothetical protein QJU97_05250 [Pasteurella skyensis]|uniref:Uncharacterized protein n=2 Tax=Phocoenobacter skyensis TaxID=97481 RepID=A0AAJ6NDM1_9PAST|nr:hypothetical protein [Pasteurella skyensis]MDP8174863.1 hypothetical protein [Pasteurella skyensis]
MITERFGENISIQAGDSHERYIRAKDLEKIISNENYVYNSLDDADEITDQLNNKIGRNIAKNSPGLSPKELSAVILDYYKNEGIFEVKKEKNIFKVFKNKLPSDIHQEAKERLKTLDNNGAGKRIRAARKKIEESYDSMQMLKGW